MALPGAVYIYQGEELGLWEVQDIPDELRQDPIFYRTHGEDPGRDGSRVPLPWSGTEPPFGFTPPGASAAPWLRQPKEWRDLTVAAESASADSMLCALPGRAAHPALRGVARRRPDDAGSRRPTGCSRSTAAASFRRCVHEHVGRAGPAPAARVRPARQRAARHRTAAARHHRLAADRVTRRPTAGRRAATSLRALPGGLLVGLAGLGRHLGLVAVADAEASASPSSATVTCCPGLSSPPSSMADSRLSTSRWIVRRSGRAPNSGWNPRRASQSTASVVKSTVMSCACSRRTVSSSSRLVIWRSWVSSSCAEDDDLVDPVEELRPERLAQPAHDPVLRLRVLAPLGRRRLRRRSRACAARSGPSRGCWS